MVVNVYERFYRADAVFSELPRRGALVMLVSDSEAGFITYKAAVTFFPHRDEEDYAVSYDACFEKELFGDDEGPELRTAVLAGEEHPVSCQISETDRGDRLSVDFYIPKGDFEYIVFIYLTDAELEDITKLFDKI